MNWSPQQNQAFAARPCARCETVFTPKKKPTARFCSSRCSILWLHSLPDYKATTYTDQHAANSGAGRKRWLASGDPKALAEIERLKKLNPRSRPEVQQKISQVLRDMQHRPLVRGGNGRGPTRPQLLLHLALGDGWELEFKVLTNIRRPKWPASYRIDVANPVLRIAIEVDGGSHCSKKNQEIDRRKTRFLRSRGWKVLRFWNADILAWIESGTASPVPKALKRHGITAATRAAEAVVIVR